MIVVHFESGLGNQMLDYADYLAVKKSNPNEKLYIENYVYAIKPAHNVVSMWNGYELDRVFGIKLDNISNYFKEDNELVISDIEKTEFWNHDWCITAAIHRAFQEHGLQLKNCCHDITRPANSFLNKLILLITRKFFYTRIGTTIKKYIAATKVRNNKGKVSNELFIKVNVDSYAGHSLKFMYKGYGIENIEQELRNTFIFPELKDKRNLEVKRLIDETNSVAIHVRRGDFLSINGNTYKYGYFKRAIKYIKKKVNDPVFFIFCEPGGENWCKENYETLGLSVSDEIFIINWNVGNDSYRDMQLMSMCKHNVITSSSFGWWGAFLNNYDRKITCSPDPRINTTNYF